MSFYEAMSEVLATSRYDFLTGRRVDIRELFWDFINRILNWLFENMDAPVPSYTEGNPDIIATIFSVVAVLMVAVAAFVLIRAWLRSRMAKQHTLEDIFEEMRTHTVAELLQLSQNAQNMRVAVRYKYIAAILSLNERDIIEIKPSATNAIILRQIRHSAPALSAPFSQIAHAFHLSWFGHKDLSDDALIKLDAAVSEVIPRER